MNDRRHHSLRRKISLALFIPLVVISLVTSYVRYLSYRKNLLQDLKICAVGISEVLSSDLGHHELPADSVEIQQILDDAARQEHVQGLVVVDQGGRVLASAGEPPDSYQIHASDENLWGAAFLEGYQPAQIAVTQHSNGSKVLRLVTPISSGKSLDAGDAPQHLMLSTLVSDFALAPLDDRLTAYIWERTFLTLVSMVLLLLATGLVMDSVVVARLKGMLETVKMTAPLHRTQVQMEGDDEISELAKEYNKMAAGLGESDLLVQEVEERSRRIQVLNERFAALNTISGAVCQSPELDDILGGALDVALRLMNLKGGWIFLSEGGADGLQPFVTRGLPEEVARVQVQCAWCRSVREEVMISGQPRYYLDSEPYPCPADQGHQDLESAATLTGTPELPCVAAVHLQQSCLAFRACIPLTSRDRVFGVMCLMGDAEIEAELLGDEGLATLTAIGCQIGVAIENVKLCDQLREKESLRRQLLTRLITAQEEERKRISRELHDHAAQSLSSLIMMLGSLQGQCSPTEARAHITQLRDAANQVLVGIRDLALDLRPSVLDDLGLVPALRGYANQLELRYRLPVDVQIFGLQSARLSAEVETTLFRLAQEALLNAARHSQAHTASLILEGRPSTVKLIVEDDGKGFDVNAVMGTQPRQGNLGLYGMQERASLVGGEVIIESTIGVGTSIFVEIPVGGDDGQDTTTRSR